jgi:hypothetical protein
MSRRPPSSPTAESCIAASVFNGVVSRALILSLAEPDLWANAGIDCVRELNQTATPKAVKLRFITAAEQNMAELGHAPLDDPVQARLENVGTLAH